jgi:hypothetical protein
VMQLFSNLCVFSKFSEKIDNVTASFYAQRARSAEQLYPHLSEFDYIKLMASPATLPFVFAMSRDWVIENSVYYDVNYDKLQIPATSFITMGNIVYSMYYPIDILVNRNTGAISAFYNVDKTTTLNTLESNILLDTQQYMQNGLNWFQISFNMYQFERAVTSYTVSQSQGFIKNLSYSDQFYALKIYNLGNDGTTWTEIPNIISNMYYDPTTPTALISLLTDSSQIKITIPQIYFNNNQINNTVKIELYTTKGTVNYGISLADATSLKANFDTSSSAYAAPLAQMPTWKILPTTTQVAGGSDANTYTEIRDAVVNQRLYDKVAVTPPEVKEAGIKAGFNLYKVIDDLTERMYYASNILTDSNGMIIPTFSGSILLANDSLAGNPSSIISFTDGYYTILPTTTFKIPNNGTTCVPMTNGEISTMGAMSKSELVSELNKGTYVRQPFHISMLTSPKSPQACVYNLLSPKMKSLSFIRENAHSAPQMSVTACSIKHQNNGTGGYLLNLQITRSNNIETVDASNFEVLLTCKDKLGNSVYFPLSYLSTSSGDDVWQMVLATSYHITTDDYITAMMYNDNDVLSQVEISLNQSFTIITAFKSTYDATVPKDTTINALLPTSFQSMYTGMAQQTLVLSLGTNLSGTIYCGINTTWGTDVYKTADTTVYFTTDTPVFQTNETGIIETRVNGTTHTLEVNQLYAMGDIPSDTNDFSISTTTVTNVPSSGTTTTFTLGDTTGVLLGMTGRGTLIPVDAVVVAKTSTSVTVNKLIISVVPIGSVITFGNGSLLKRTTQSQSSAGKILKVVSTVGIYPGQSVIGFDVPINALVESVDSTTQIKITIPTTTIVSNNTLLTFINKTAHGVVKVAQGDVERDVTGKAIVIKSAKNQYRIPSIMFDGRIFASDDLTDTTIVSNICQYIQNYTNQIATIDAGLLEDSEVYYRPSRTMGYATFGIGNSQTTSLPLSLSFSVNVYVSLAVYNNPKLKATMTESIYSTINAEIQNSIISVSNITETIATKLGTNVIDVEMGGINGNDKLRLIALEESDSKPSIEYVLTINPDNTISRVPNITVNYIPAPDTTMV